MKDLKIVVVVFVYGDIKKETNICIIRDLVLEANRAGMKTVIDMLDEETKNMMPPFVKNIPTLNISYAQASPDSLIERSRSFEAKKFLDGDGDVLLMLDHDIQWQGEKDGYVGDLVHVALMAHEKQGIVGAIVPKRCKNEGLPIVTLTPHQDFILGQEGCVEIIYMGAAFTAYPRAVLEAVSSTMEPVLPGFKPIFQTMVTEHPHAPGQMLHISEDWALCERARMLGFKTYAATKPLTVHHGDYGYTAVNDSGCWIPHGERM